MNTDSGRSEGAVREAGGAFSKKEKAHEDQFFQKKQQEQLKNLKDAHKDEIKHHKEDRKSTRLNSQSHHDLVCRLLLEKKKNKKNHKQKKKKQKE